MLILLFAILRAAHGAGAIPRWLMCLLMSFSYTLHEQDLMGIWLFPTLWWAYSIGWALGGKDDVIADWSAKFSPSGDFLTHLARLGVWRHNQLFALGWLPRIFMTFWLPLAVADRLVWLPVLCVGWGLAYYLAGFWKDDRHIRLAEALSAALLGAILM